MAPRCTPHQKHGCVTAHKAEEDRGGDVAARQPPPTHRRGAHGGSASGGDASSPVLLLLSLAAGPYGLQSTGRGVAAAATELIAELHKQAPNKARCQACSQKVKHT